MSSKVDIINASLLLLGHRSVNNLGDNSGEDVKKAVALYDIYYTSLLTRYAWGFALKQAPLNAPSSFDPVPEFSYAYLIPNDYLLIDRIEPIGNYQIYKNLIYTNLKDDNLKLFYTAYVKEGNLPDYYIEFLVEFFASIFAMPITQQPELFQIFEQRAKEALDQAIMVDSQSQPSLQIKSSPLVQAKYSYNTGN